ncbi:DUF2877 domain-containing protein [Lentibacillus sp. L22]|uniref:DUF2877 domain-containing protein n=1 Tax=Lentibacillus TaxID=175304 RepID=UPI0022B11B40|nr:DUF2877 domain-containing protein [Lentibacillus daqui]
MKKNQSIVSVKRLKACMLSSGIYDILEYKVAGKVHSVFATSFNLIFADQLIHIGPMKHGIAPFGIGVDLQRLQRLTRRISQGQVVRWDQNLNSIVFADQSLLLESAKVIHNSLIINQLNQVVLDRNVAFAAQKLFEQEWQTGIVSDHKAIKKIFTNFLFPKVPNVKESTLQPMHDLLRLAGDDHLINADTVFHYWIGRGPGLTPSGDDMITGICAGLHIFNQSDSIFSRKLKHFLVEHGKQKTTKISLEYLFYAAENQFHSHLIYLCKRLVQSDVNKLINAMEIMRQIGHTSGTDTLIGILLGIKAIRWKKTFARTIDVTNNEDH